MSEKLTVKRDETDKDYFHFYLNGYFIFTLFTDHFHDIAGSVMSDTCEVMEAHGSATVEIEITLAP